MIESHGFSSDGVDVRGDFTRVAVAAQVIRPAGIDADEKDIANLFM